MRVNPPPVPVTVTVTDPVVAEAEAVRVRTEKHKGLQDKGEKEGVTPAGSALETLNETGSAVPETRFAVIVFVTEEP